MLLQMLQEFKAGQERGAGWDWKWGIGETDLQIPPPDLKAKWLPSLKEAENWKFTF